MLGTPDEMKTANELLQQITESFRKAEEKSRKILNKKSSTEPSQARSTANDQCVNVEEIHQLMNTLALKRRGKRSFRHKVAWALQDKKIFDEMYG